MMADRSLQLKSMTAFGRGVSDFAYGHITVEIQSVNRRFLEINMTLPRLLDRFETEMRKSITAHVGRGMLTVSLFWKTEGRQPVAILPNLRLARALKKAWEGLATELGLDKKLPIELLIQEKELFVYEEELAEEKACQKAMHEALEKALSELTAMKVQEGTVLAQDLRGRFRSLSERISLIEKQAPVAVDKYRQKLVARLEELFSGASENEEKVLREVAVYAERIDITEEIIRFKSHLEQCLQALEWPLEEVTETRGKRLDFLLQELLRETNTIGSKASDLTAIQQVVAIKGELEKIREQVQNIE